MVRATCGLDIAKNVMQLHRVEAGTGETGRKKPGRARLAANLAELRPVRIVMAACGSAHHWARVFAGLGHQVELLPAAQVRGFVRSRKDDAADARAIRHAGPFMADDSAMNEAIHVACLCAAWCRTCDGYRPVFDRVAAELRAAGAEARWHWIDIEDEADLVGDFDVETFPTIVVCDAQRVRFAGPVTPQPETLARLLRSLLLETVPAAPWPAEVEGFAQRLRRT